VSERPYRRAGNCTSIVRWQFPPGSQRPTARHE